MSLDNNSANNFKDFLDAIKPYLNYQPVDLSCMGIDAFQFSTDEKPVGMWTDGRIIYQKVIDTNILSQSSKKYIQHNIQNIGDYKRVVSVMFPISNNVYSPCRVSSYDAFQSLINDSEIEFSINGSWASNFTRVIVIVQYTKTTDSPLSADEKFAGVWIDGSPMFEKTISASNVTMANNANVKIGTITGYNFVTVDNATVKNAAGASFVNSKWVGAHIDENGNVYANQVFSQASQTCDVYITVRYTKTP